METPEMSPFASAVKAYLGASRFELWDDVCPKLERWLELFPNIKTVSLAYIGDGVIDITYTKEGSDDICRITASVHVAGCSAE